jgi:hypothetical protein
MYSGDTAGQILIDPMTKEVIGKVPDLDQYGKEKLDRMGKPIYQNNDNWFVLNVKFIWRGAPSLPEQAVVSKPSYYGAPPPQTSKTPAPNTSSNKGIKGMDVVE